MKAIIITICLMLLVPGACVCGAELLVPSQYPTIQAAVNAAVNGDTVVIAPGTYTGPGNRDIAIEKPITIRSQDGPETCIIDCNGSISQPHTGFTIINGTLAGLTITGGNSFHGGAVSCGWTSISNVKLTNCILTGNISKQGGAISCRNSNLEITNCSLTNNSSGVATAGSGGAIYCENGSILATNSTISGNSSVAGGGIYCANQADVTIKNCVISGNSTLGDPWANLGGLGGGIYCGQGSMIVIGSDISRNRSPRGAGIYCASETSCVISDSNIHDNVADANGGKSAGGGICYIPSPCTMTPMTLAIVNSSITDNIVKGTESKGGGLYIETVSMVTCVGNIRNVVITDCVIARNSAQAQPYKANSYGGGIYSIGRILLSETEIKQNSATRGGGIYNQISGTNISRCRISGNSAIFGSAIEFYTGETTLENSIISGNQALGISTAGKMCSVFQCNTSSILKIANCTIIGNTPPVIYPRTLPQSSITNSIIYWNSQYRYIDELPSDLLISYSDIQGGYAGTGNIDIDPCFAISGHWDINGTPNYEIDDFWVEGDYRLTAVSPCINAGTYVPLSDNKDMAGNPRVMGAAIDMGAYENNNDAPIAEAGPDQNVFAWIDGNAAVTLDGSKSYDPDGGKLSYLWNWAVDGSDNEANGINPTIKLPVGRNKIELIVNDKLEDSQPDDVNITVIGPIEGRLSIIPSTIIRKSEQPNILTLLRLPAGITKEQIDSGYKLLLYPGGIQAKSQCIMQCWDNGAGRIGIVASFDRSALLTSFSANGSFKLYAVGRLTTSQYFFGQNMIRIFDPPPVSYLPKFDK